MAKKKQDYKAMTEEQLVAELETATESQNTEVAVEVENEMKGRKSKTEKATKMKKAFANLGKYKDKIKYKEASYKPQEWIEMSSAWKEVTRLPGIPLGATVVVGGRPDVGKSTVAMEAAAFAQKQGILPVFILTENKFSIDRAEKMGIDFDDALIFNSVRTIEEGCAHVKKILDDQESGVLANDVLIIWDSIGGTPSQAELKSHEEDSGRAMMETAKVINTKIGRYLGHRINNTRNESFPYNATFLIINQAYTQPGDMPGAPPKIVFRGGDGATYSASLIVRMGGVKAASSKIMATKDGIEVAFAIRTAVVVEKNHVTNVCAKGKIICTDHGFVMDNKDAIDEYKKENKDGWDLNYDKVANIQFD